MKKLLLVLVFTCFGASAQDLITFSFEYGTLESKGFEIRKELDGVYVGLFAENLTNDDEIMFNWGINTGFSTGLRSFKLFYGANAGLIKRTAYGSNKQQYFNIGANVELDYNITESFFVGLKGKLDTYEADSTREFLIRPVFKIGYKF